MHQLLNHLFNSLTRVGLLGVLVTIAGNAAPIFNGNSLVPAGEASGMQVLYEISVPGTNPGYRNATPVPYTTDNSGLIALGSYSRIGYYVEVLTGTQAGQFVYISMDAFDLNPATLGVPHNVNNPVTRKITVNNANVFSDVASIITGLGIATVNLEMWPSNYATGANGVFDYDDNNFNTGAGHGSFQIHNAGAAQTLFGWSDWGGNNVGGALSEFGLGNATLLGEPHPDWTFSDRGQIGFIQILVGSPLPPAAPVPEPATLGLLAILLTAGVAARQRHVRKSPGIA